MKIYNIKVSMADSMIAYWIDPSGKKILATNGHAKEVPIIAKEYDIIGTEYNDLFLDNFIRISIFNNTLMINGKSIRAINESQKESILSLANNMRVIMLDFEDYHGTKTLKDRYELDDVLHGKVIRSFAQSEQSNYIILGLTDEEGSESKKVEENSKHYEFSWSKSITFSYHWVYFPKKNSIFSWDDLNNLQKESVLSHLEDKYGITNTKFDNISRFNPIEEKEYIDASSEEFNIKIASGGIKAYHGSKANIEEFSYDFTGTGRDQLGSGFYFTTSRKDASRFIFTSKDEVIDQSPLTQNSPTVYEVLLNIKNPLDAEKIGTISRSNIKKLMIMSPYFEDALTDWGDVEFEGKNIVINRAIDTYTKVANNNYIVKALFPLANDFYKNDTKAFNDAVTKVLGYDGVVKDFGNCKHYLAFRPDQITIIGRSDPIKEASSNQSVKTSSWYHKEEKEMPKPYKITKVTNDRNEDIASLKGKIKLDTTSYGALKKFLKEYPFLYDYEEMGITLMAVVDEARLEEVKEKYRRKLEEKQRNKDKEIRERMENTWYGKD